MIPHPEGSSFWPASLENRVSPGCRERVKIERSIAQSLIGTVLAAGLSITVNDGEEDAIVKSKNPEDIRLLRLWK